MIYPSEGGLAIFIRDFTEQKKKEYHLKLMQSVVTNSKDAILITEPGPFEKHGPRILYVNESFTKMTGYTQDELIGKTPRIFQGPKTDQQELKRLSDSVQKWEPCECTIINYKKNGDEFLVNFSLTPITDEKGAYTHWISTDRDVTQRHNSDLLKTLVAEISLLFNQAINLQDTLQKVLKQLVDFGSFVIAEAWLVGRDESKIVLSAKYLLEDNKHSFYEDAFSMSLKKGEGLPGSAWKTGETQFCNTLDEIEIFNRKDATKKLGLKSVYGFPLIYNSEVIGVLVLGLKDDTRTGIDYMKLLETICSDIAAEIKRKQLEQDLNQIFYFAPDIICVAGNDGYYKKINPAMSRLMEYTETEILALPMIHFIYPEDLLKSTQELKKLAEGKPTLYFENRIVTKFGKVKWLAWTATPSPEEGLLFCVAKDITDKKELEVLFNKASNLARIGSWEIDLIKGTVFWSQITKNIHGVEPDFEPDKESAANFFKAGANRDLMVLKMTETVEKNIPFIVEIQIVNAQGIDKWVRINGEAEYSDHECLRVYGSVQDIDDRKTAEALVVTEKLKYIQSIETQNAKLKEISWMQSHIIRAPLARIMGLIQLMDDSSRNIDETKEIMEYISLSARELDTVINDITDIIDIEV